MNILRYVLFKLHFVELVWLVDFDGEEHLRILRTAKPWNSASGRRWAIRFPCGIATVRLNDDGSTSGCCYCKIWRPFAKG